MSIATKKSAKTTRTKVMTPAATTTTSIVSVTLASAPTVSAASVAARAYELWIESGMSHGHHLAHWLQAERELSQ